MAIKKIEVENTQSILLKIWTLNPCFSNVEAFVYKHKLLINMKPNWSMQTYVEHDDNHLTW
jgi:hypothetical protein